MTRRQRYAFTATVISILILMGSAMVHANGVVISGGPARVIDGDTLALKGVRIRLHGIDAPESGQTCQRDGQPYACGTASTQALEALAGGRDLVCEWRDTDRHRRLVVDCWLLDGTGKQPGKSINAQMVRSGNAIAYRKYSDAYITHEREVREARHVVGIIRDAGGGPSRKA